MEPPKKFTFPAELYLNTKDNQKVLAVNRFCINKLLTDQGNSNGESAVAAIFPSHLEDELLYPRIGSFLSPPSNLI